MGGEAKAAVRTSHPRWAQVVVATVVGMVFLLLAAASSGTGGDGHQHHHLVGDAHSPPRLRPPADPRVTMLTPASRETAPSTTAPVFPTSAAPPTNGAWPPPSQATAATAGGGGTGRYLTINPLQPWYGLTNQLMCYAAALRYGIDDRRAVLFPALRTTAAVLSFYDLVDVPATLDSLAGSGASIVYPSEADKEFGYFTAPPSFVEPSTSAMSHSTVPRSLYPPVSMNKRKLFLPERTEYRQRDAARARRSREYLVNKVYARSSKDRFVRHHNFFMRFAWPVVVAGAGAAADSWGECRLMASIQPQRDMVAYADRLISGIVVDGEEGNKGAAAGGFVAIHLRLESDASLLRGHGAKPTTAAQFRDFLRNSAAPFARAAGAAVVYLCTGALPPALAAVIDDATATSFDGVKVTYRAAVVKATASGLPPIRSFRGSQREVHAAKGHGSRTQDHYMSFVELLVLQRARRAAVTHFSSLKFAVFARRCGGERRVGETGAGAEVERAVHTLSIHDDGSISKAFDRFDCAGASGLGWCGHRSWGEG